MSDTEKDKIDSIFIIPDEEKELRAKRKAQLEARKQKNKELRAKIARSKAIEKSEQKKTVKKNKSDIEDLKEQLRKIREENNLNTVQENKLSNNLDDKQDKQNNIPISNNEKNDIPKKEIQKDINLNDPTIKKAEKMIKDIDNKVDNKIEKKVEKKEEIIEKKVEPQKRVINPLLLKRRF